MPFISWSCDQNRSGCNHDQDFIKNAAIMEIWTNWTETGQIGGVSYQQNRGVTLGYTQWILGGGGGYFVIFFFVFFVPNAQV